MTNEHEDAAMDEREATLHEKLCAYVLGEASESERAEIERALAESAELRAEREKLEATIGLVRESMTRGEALSPEATADVLSAAGVKRARPWYFSTPIGIAAGIVAVTLVYAAYQSHDDRVPAARMAQVDRRELALESKLDDASNMRDNTEKKERGTYRGPGDSAPPGNGGGSPLAASAPSRPGEAAAAGNLLAQNAPSSTAATAPSAGDAERSELTDAVIDRKAPGADGEPGYSVIGVGHGSPIQAQADSSGGPAARVAGPATGGPSPATSTFSGRSMGKARHGGPSGGARDSHADDFYLANNGYAPASKQNAKDELASVPGELRRLGYTSGDEDDASLKLKTYRLSHAGYLELQKELAARDGRTLDNLTPEERDRYIDQRCREIVEYCHRRPNEQPRDMYFRFWGDNAFQLAALDAQSTFSVDVDTASYALARRYLNEGHMPEKAQVRTEEFVNYFKPDVAAPREGTFAIQTELAPSRFSNDAQRTMLRVVVRGHEVSKLERKPLSLTFVIDCSGSMIEQGRLEMVKHAIRLLLHQLDANDSVAIIAFSSDARMVLPMTSAKNKDLIESALFPLKPENSTNSEAGLKMGYECALAGINANAQNRVVFLSDGVANVGETDPAKLAEGVKRIREKGVYLNTIGVGMNNHNDALLEQLADKGDGVCNYIDSPDEAKRVMVDNFTGAMETIARDVKIQVEFDPAQVYRYRLLGYENRFIANKDFRNDKIDAGEVGAGHQVCALYELELANKPAQDAGPKPLATVRLRWKAPRDVRRPDANEEATEIERPVLASQMTSYDGASFGYKRAVIVAQFAEFLRRSTHARGRSLDDLIAEAKKIENQGDDDFRELVTLLEKGRGLILANLPACDELCQAVDVIRRNQILRAEHEMLSTERDAKLLEELARQNADLEQRIRELLRHQLEQRSK
jgi:Ca-activated chloride channel family protein